MLAIVGIIGCLSKLLFKNIKISKKVLNIYTLFFDKINDYKYYKDIHELIIDYEDCYYIIDNGEGIYQMLCQLTASCNMHKDLMDALQENYRIELINRKNSKIKIKRYDKTDKISYLLNNLQSI